MIFKNAQLLKICVITLIAVYIAGCSSESTLATIGDKTIYQNDFDAYLKLKRISINDERQKESLLNKFLQAEALAQAVERSDILDEKLINAELNEYRKEILLNRYMEKYLADNVSDDAILNYYNANASEFENKKIHVAHILFRTSTVMDDIQRKAKLTTAQEAYSKIKAGGDFSEIAKRYSEDTVSGKKGGDLGWINQGSLEQGFIDKVFTMKSGTLSEPFESKYGYHIVKVIEGPVTEIQPFDVVKGNIRHKLRTEIRQTEIERLVSAIKINR